MVGVFQCFNEFIKHYVLHFMYKIRSSDRYHSSPRFFAKLEEFSFILMNCNGDGNEMLYAVCV